MGHAIIVVGEGAIAHANVLAKGKNCLVSNAPSNPCGNCQSCKVFDSGNHPDTFCVTKTKASGIGVDDVRDQIISPMSTKPFSYNFKVFIIDKAETLTPAAQSALLKTIEEPAPYGFFLFAAPHIHNFLPTILSRCHLYKVGGTMVMPPNTELADLAKEIAETVQNCDTMGAFQLYRKFESYKDSKERLQELLDLIYHAYGAKITAIIGTGQSPPEAWLNATAVITKTKTALSQNGNTQLAIELMLAKLAEKR